MAVTIYYPTVDSEGKRIVNPSFPITEGIKSNTITFTSDAGNTQVRQKGALKLTYDLNYVALTASQYETLKNFYIARKGTVEPFNWVHPITKQVIVVRFASEQWAGKLFTQNIKTPLYSVDIKIEEVI